MLRLDVLRDVVGEETGLEKISCSLGLELDSVNQLELGCELDRMAGMEDDGLGPWSEKNAVSLSFEPSLPIATLLLFSSRVPNAGWSNGGSGGGGDDPNALGPSPCDPNVKPDEGEETEPKALPGVFSGVPIRDRVVDGGV